MFGFDHFRHEFDIKVFSSPVAFFVSDVCLPSEMEIEMLGLSEKPVNEALKIIKNYESMGWEIEYRELECETSGKKWVEVSSYNKRVADERNPPQ